MQPMSIVDKLDTRTDTHNHYSSFIRLQKIDDDFPFMEQQ